MCVLTHNEIIKKIASGELHIDPYEEGNIGPASYDLHLGKTFRVFKKVRGTLTLDQAVDLENISYLTTIKNTFLLMPTEMVHAITQEQIILPDNLCGWLEGKSSLGRLGLAVHVTAGFIQPGTQNKQVLEISNLGPIALELKPGMAICQIVFEETRGKAHYRGHYFKQTSP